MPVIQPNTDRSHPLHDLDATLVTAHEAMEAAHDLKEWDKLITVAEAYHEARGGLSPLACLWYSQALQATGRLKDGCQWAQVAAEQMPKDEKDGLAAAYSTYAMALGRVGQFALSRKWLWKATEVTGTSPSVGENLGHILLSISQEWRRGWRWTEGRLLTPERALPPGFHWWDGQTKEPVAVLHEQGIGDAILAARWVPWLMETTGHPVTYYGPSIIQPWMREMPGVVIGNIDDAAKAETTTPAIRIMSFPHVKGISHPSKVDGPWVPGTLLAARKYRTHDTFRVGVCWRGSRTGWHDSERSYTVEQFMPLLEPIDGVEFINLTHEASLPNQEAVVFQDVMDSGRAVASCDLVISVDTAIVHIAGSLGVPTLALLPTVADWRYAWPRGGTTPFYQSVTGIRKQRADDQSPVLFARRLLEGYVSKLLRVA